MGNLRVDGLKVGNWRTCVFISMKPAGTRNRNKDGIVQDGRACTRRLQSCAASCAAARNHNEDGSLKDGLAALRVYLKAGLHICSTIKVHGGWGVVIVSARAQTTSCHLCASAL